MTPWQETVLERFEKDVASGVAWHPMVKEHKACKNISKSMLLREIRFYAASCFLQSEGKYIPLNNTEARLAEPEVSKVLIQHLGEKYAEFIDELEGDNLEGDKSVKVKPDAIRDVVIACMEANSFDPRQSFGVWSGKIYPAPGNPSKRLYRNNLWDINSWITPEYRKQKATEETLGAFQAFLDFCLPRELEQTVLLDWLAWSLQHEAQRPNWAIFLYSDEKGTGKSTILDVARALFGEENTARENGLEKLVSRFALESLNKKLVTVEEVKITSFSKEGNILKEYITGNKVSVDVKYKPQQTLPMTACFMMTTNHRPIWLEGGERRYYIIHLTHDGHAQGPRSDEFKKLVDAVYQQINNPVLLKGLYTALMNRQLQPDFNPKGLSFSKYASPIMKDLLKEAVVETDEVLEDLLTQYQVTILPSSEQRVLERHFGIKSAALRHQLVRLGWEDARVSISGKQQRVWKRKDIVIENAMMCAPELSEKLPEAVELGFVWWPVTTALFGWEILKRSVLDNSFTDFKPLSPFEQLRDYTGDEGPFLDSKRSARYWAREEAAAWTPEF